MRRASLWIGMLATLMIGGAASLPDTSAPGSNLAELKALYQRPEGIPFPADNPYSKAKETLGRMLFFDPILSGAHNVSCASCHNPGLSWADGMKQATGTSRMLLHTPTLINVAWVPVLGWDGKFPSLESVAFGPLLNPANMNNTETEIISRLTNIPGYVEAFAQAFPEAKSVRGVKVVPDRSAFPKANASPPDGDATIVTRPSIEQAIATYERTIVASPAPFDRWIEGDETAIGAAAKKGFVLFNGKAACSNCHEGPSFSDFSFHDIGIAGEDDIGRGRMFPSSVKLKHAFKAPTLRDVSRRAPYMHDGSLPTLGAVIDAYNSAGIDRPSRSDLIHPLGLTQAEKQDLIAFLNTLTGDSVAYEVPMLPR